VFCIVTMSGNVWEWSPQLMILTLTQSSVIVWIQNCNKGLVWFTYYVASLVGDLESKMTLKYCDIAIKFQVQSTCGRVFAL
jgi:hypothetical protein